MTPEDMDENTGSKEWFAGYNKGTFEFIGWVEQLINTEHDKRGKFSNPRIEKIRDWVIDHKKKICEPDSVTRTLENDIVTAAMFWWKSNKPDDWSDEEHITHPEIDICNDPTNVKKRLARCCAKYLKYINDSMEQV